MEKFILRSTHSMVRGSRPRQSAKQWKIPANTGCVLPKLCYNTLSQQGALNGPKSSSSNAIVCKRNEQAGIRICATYAAHGLQTCYTVSFLTQNKNNNKPRKGLLFGHSNRGVDFALPSNHSRDC